MGRITIIGCGNILAYDEGVGIHAVRRLQNEILPGNVVIKEFRNPGQLLTELITGADKLIIIDACPNRGKAGHIHRFTKKEGQLAKILTNTVHAHHLYPIFEPKDRASSQQLPEEIVVFAIEIEENKRFSVGLSKSVFSSLDDIVEKVLQELY